MEQGSLVFDAPLARRHDPVTSHSAADRAQKFSKHHEATIFNAICEAGPLGANFKEIAQMTGMEPVAVARRLSSMEERKLIERRLKPGATKPRDYQERDGCALWWRT